MVWTNTKRHVEIFSRQRSHPHRRLQLLAKEPDHFCLHLLVQCVADRDEHRTKVVAVMDFVHASIRKSTPPDAFSRDVELKHFTAQLLCFGAQCRGLLQSSALFQQLGRETQVIYVRRIQSRDLVYITTDSFEQV